MDAIGNLQFAIAIIYICVSGQQRWPQCGFVLFANECVCAIHGAFREQKYQNVNCHRPEMIQSGGGVTTSLDAN